MYYQVRSLGVRAPEAWALPSTPAHAHGQFGWFRSGLEQVGVGQGAKREPDEVWFHLHGRFTIAVNGIQGRFGSRANKSLAAARVVRAAGALGPAEAEAARAAEATAA